MQRMDVNQRFADANPIALKEWLVAELVGLFRDFGTATKAEEVSYIATRVIAELRQARRFDRLPVGFIGTGLKGILNGVYDVKKLTVQTILSSLVKEGNSLLPQGQNLQAEATPKDYARLYARAAKYGDPQARGSVWAIQLSCSRGSSEWLRFAQRKLNGFWGAAAILAGLDPNVLISATDEEFAQLRARLWSSVVSLQRKFEAEEGRRRARANAG